MANFILIGLCIIAGILFRKNKILPKDAHKGINAWIIYIALPAVSFKYLPHITFTKELLFPVLAPICVWVLGWAYISFYKKINPKMSLATAGGMKLTSSLSNTSFIGFTIFEMAMPTLLTAGVVADQYNLNPKVSNLVVGIGIVLSFLTTGIWWLVLNYPGLV
ncbi:MAG: hypothetical protein EOO91_19045 [Pedobacter sp.]|nr:MAG: hypothetical protein EOO91_19045 [Pedobacter sp.]